jgi:hypothetical protein
VDDPSLNNVPAILALIVPVVAVTLGLATAMLSMWLDFRKKREMYQLYHAERMAAIEKGVDLPPLPPEFFQSNRRAQSQVSSLRRGLMCSLAGGAATLALWGSGEKEFWYGLVPVGVGLAYLISYFAERPRKSATHDSAGKDLQGPL